MRSTHTRSVLFRWSARTGTGLSAALVMAVAGCAQLPGAGRPVPEAGETVPTAPEETSGKIVNVSSGSLRVSAMEPPISVIYTVTGTPDLISGFYVQVADNSPGAQAIGDRVIAATNLPSGENQAFDFDPSAAGVGFYRVGIIMLTNGEELIAESDGVVQVEGPPAPVFIQPADPITVVFQGDEVPVRFDAGDPEGDARWRLFYVPADDPLNNPPAELGEELELGRGNVGIAVFPTSGLAPGDYRLGVSATDSGLSIAASDPARVVTVAGPIVRVVEVGAVLSPTLTWIAPGANDVELFRDATFELVFDAMILEPGATGLIELFYDDDSDVSNGFRATIEGAEALPAATTTSFMLPTDLPEGSWYVGGTVRTIGGSSPPVTEYAKGRIVIVREPTLRVTKPDSTLPVEPSTTVKIAWTTNAPDSSGTVDVVARSVAGGGTISILSSEPMATRSAEFSSDSPGLFDIVVRLNFIDDTTKEATAPERVRVSSLPRILWLGSLTEDEPPFEGAIFGGVNFEDNAGSSLTRVSDLNGDGNDDFVIGARYGKPFFRGQSGVGPGEAYLIFGAGGLSKLRGEFNLNSVGTSTLPGVLFAGIRTPQDSNDTDGMSSVSRIPDVDGDEKDELVFGFPDTDSRGHNINPQQDGVIDPAALATLEREDQFLRGGIVIVSSQNSVFLDAASPGGTINLDVVGQDFDVTCVEPEPDDAPIDDSARLDFYVNTHGDVDDQGEGCEGDCDDPSSAGKPDSTDLDYGFALALARDYFSAYVYSWEFFGGVRFCSSVDDFLNHECLEEISPPVAHEYCAPFVATCEPFSPGLHDLAFDPDPIFPFTDTRDPHPPRHSGFYSTFVTDADDNVFRNMPREPLGARIIGVGIGDKFGTSLALSNARATGAGDIIVSAPQRTARGILLGQFPQGCFDPPSCGGEIDGLESAPGSPKVNIDAGVAYLFPLRSLWTDDAFGRIPPKPHQYIVGEASHSCSAQGLPLIDNIAAIRIAGEANENIANVIGIDDFNNDGRNDFVVGAPTAGGAQGRVYICYRRERSAEGDYVLEKLALDPDDPDRLDGLLVVSDNPDAFGSSLATGVDFNGDDLADVVIGSPAASGDLGEIIVLFSNTGIISPAGGFTVDDLLEMRTADGEPVAVRITGNPLDNEGQFGFNIANAGDVDGDGLGDLLVAAPNASPRFDPDPNDVIDELTEPGLDADSDGIADDVSGPQGVPDGVLTSYDELQSAGIVYVITSGSRLDQLRTCTGTGEACSSSADCDTGATCSSNSTTISVDQLGTSALRGFMIVGRRAGDRLGGGDAGDAAQGGNTNKTGRGRSHGVASAGDVDGDGRADILIGSILADPRLDPITGDSVTNGGEAYLIYGSASP